MTEHASHDWIPLTELADQERLLQFQRFSHDRAWNLGTAFVQDAFEHETPVVIDISLGEQQLFHAAMRGTVSDHDMWIDRMVRVVRRFGHSSLYVGQRSRDAGTDFVQEFALPIHQYAAYGGAFPITVRNAGVVGVVAVSGLRELDNHRFVTHLLEQYLRDDV